MSDVPFCLNFSRFADYLLAPDEVVLFEWLLFKQYYFGVRSYFHYSKPRIEADTRIGRRRQEAIIKKFEDMGFLHCITMHDNKKGSLTRNFKIDYGVLANENVLSQIVNEESFLFGDYQKYFSEVCPF